MCDPATLALGTALSVGGGLLSRNSANRTAEAEANARNGVLSRGIADLQGDYNNINAPAFSGAVGAVNPSTLKPAQDARTNAILGNLPPPTAGAPASPDAPPALASTRAAMMKNSADFLRNQGTATGNLGGYGDQWFNSNLGAQDAARKIGVGNSFANETKSLIGPEQDLAAAATYRPPSMLGGIMQGVGGMLGSASGGKRNIGSIFANMGGGGIPDSTEGVFS